MKRFIHFVNNSNKDILAEDETFWEIRPIAEKLHDTFLKAILPDEHQ